MTVNEHFWYSRLLRIPSVAESVRLPGEDQESRSHQVCHSWRRRNIGVTLETSVSFLAKIRNPGVTLDTSCVIPGEDQESRSHPGYKRVIPGEDQESRSHPGYKRVISWRRSGIQESPWIAKKVAWSSQE